MDRFRRGDLSFDVRDGGPPDGEPVVLLHGFPQEAAAWARVEPSLHEAGLRTLAPDQRGYSAGARPRGRSAYQVKECVADVLALLDAAGLESAHVVGHDWGGFVAWGLGGRHAGRVRSLTVLSTPHPAAMGKAFLGRQALMSWYMFAFQAPVLPELALRRPGAAAAALRRSGLPRDIADHYASHLADPDFARATLNWYRAIPWSQRTPPGRIAVPTTFVWGNQDIALGRKASVTTGDYVTADYTFTELDAGHWLPETHPDVVSEQVLTRVKSATTG
jgi:pimeloyl-ACP methyl ester carboxylesterase